MDPVEFLVGLVRRYSPSGSEAAVAEYARDELRAAGVEAYLDGAGNICAEIGAGECALLMLGHIDTVEGEWPVRIEDGCLHGRGSVDAKGPFAAFATALVRMADTVSGRVVLVGAVEEETLTSRGARFIVDKYRPRYCVIGEPSGWQGLTLGYKGRLFLRYHLVSTPKHGAAPGPSPMQRAVDYWNALRAYQEQVNAEKSVFYQLDLELDDVRQDATPLRTEVKLTAYARLPIGLDLAAFHARARELSADPEAAVETEVELIDDAPPFLATKDNPLVQAFRRAIRARDGQPTLKVKTGTSDMNIVGPAWEVPILAYGPGDASLDHTPLEFLRIEEYLRSIDIMADVIARLCGTSTPDRSSDRVQAGES